MGNEEHNLEHENNLEINNENENFKYPISEKVRVNTI